MDEQRQQIPYSQIKRGGCYTLVEIDHKKNYIIGVVIQTFTESEWDYDEVDTDFWGSLIHLRDEYLDEQDCINKNQISDSKKGCATRASKYMVFESTQSEKDSLRTSIDFGDFVMPPFRRQFLDQYNEQDFQIQRRKIPFKEMEIGKVYTLIDAEHREYWLDNGKWLIHQIIKFTSGNTAWKEGPAIDFTDRFYYEERWGKSQIDTKDPSDSMWAFEATEKEKAYLEEAIKLQSVPKGKFNPVFEDTPCTTERVNATYDIF